LGWAAGSPLAKGAAWREGLPAGTRDGLHTSIIGPVQAAAAPPWPRSRDQFQLHALNKYTQQLRKHADGFLHDPDAGNELRHVAVLGDLNEEPFDGLLQAELMVSLGQPETAL
jgi:hypothetical protein